MGKYAAASGGAEAAKRWCRVGTNRQPSQSDQVDQFQISDSPRQPTLLRGFDKVNLRSEMGRFGPFVRVGGKHPEEGFSSNPLLSAQKLAAPTPSSNRTRTAVISLSFVVL